MDPMGVGGGGVQAGSGAAWAAAQGAGGGGAAWAARAYGGRVQYYYSIKDISIGGRCVCHGHADVCDAKDPTDPFR